MTAPDITIPDEAINAFLREVDAHYENLSAETADAACLAMLKAWPGVIHNGHWLLFPHTKLPLPQEASDE